MYEILDCEYVATHIDYAIFNTLWLQTIERLKSFLTDAIYSMIFIWIDYILFVTSFDIVFKHMAFCIRRHHTHVNKGTTAGNENVFRLIWFFSCVMFITFTAQIPNV